MILFVKKVNSRDALKQDKRPLENDKNSKRSHVNELSIFDIMLEWLSVRCKNIGADFQELLNIQRTIDKRDNKDDGIWLVTYHESSGFLYLPIMPVYMTRIYTLALSLAHFSSIVPLFVYAHKKTVSFSFVIMNKCWLLNSIFM